MAVTRYDLAKALRGTQGFRQPLASAVRPENGPGWSLCFQTRAWAGDTWSRSPPTALGPLALGDGRAAGEAAMATRRSVTEVGLPSGARGVGDGWGHTGRHPAQPLAPASAPVSAFGAAVPTPARPSHSSKYVVRSIFSQGRGCPSALPYPPLSGNRLPPGPFPLEGTMLIPSGTEPVSPAAGSTREWACLTFLCTPAHSPCPARLALNPFIYRIFFLRFHYLEIPTHSVFITSFPSAHISLNFKALIPQTVREPILEREAEITSEIDGGN